MQHQTVHQNKNDKVVFISLVIISYHTSLKCLEFELKMFVFESLSIRIK